MVLHTQKTTKRWTMQEVVPCPLQIALPLFYLCSNLPQLIVGKFEGDLLARRKSRFQSPRVFPWSAKMRWRTSQYSDLLIQFGWGKFDTVPGKTTNCLFKRTLSHSRLGGQDISGEFHNRTKTQFYGPFTKTMIAYLVRSLSKLIFLRFGHADESLIFPHL